MAVPLNVKSKNVYNISGPYERVRLYRYLECILKTVPRRSVGGQMSYSAGTRCFCANEQSALQPSTQEREASGSC